MLDSTFLMSVFQNLLASAIYGYAVASVKAIVRRRSFEKRYKKAFERAISSFYADPDMVGNEARRNYDDYMTMLQDASKQEDILTSNNHVYEELLELFSEEVARDKWLLGYTLLKGLFANQKKLGEFQRRLNETIAIIKESRIESHEEHQKLSKQLEFIKELVTKPQIDGLTITTLQGSAVAQTDEHVHIIDRKALIDKCINLIDSGKLLILYGALKVGKTTLAGLIVKKRPGVGVLDDVTFSKLDYVVGEILATDSNEIGVVVSTAPLNANISTLDFTKIEQIEIPLLTISEVRELVGTYNPTADFSIFISGFSGGHPVLVRTLCTYLSSVGWKININSFSSLLNYSFDTDLTRSLSDLLSHIITDEKSRALFNRLLLVIGGFTEDTVCKLASIDPQIDEPRRRLYELIPSWVTNVGADFKVNPLFGKAWKADVSDECCKGCYTFLAEDILRLKRSLSENDVLNYINYSVRAGEFDDAGMMLICVLNKLHDAGVGISKKSLLRSIWIDIALPSEMSITVKTGVRIAQLLLIDDLSKVNRHYLLWDLKQLVSENKESQYKAFFYSTVTMLCWQEEEVAEGLKFYEEYKALPKDETQGFLTSLGESLQLFDNNIWFFLLQLSTVDGYDSWLDTFKTAQITYEHSDNLICENCYMSITRFATYHLVNVEYDERVATLLHILDKAEKCDCPELAIASIAQVMDFYTSEKRYSDAQFLFLQKYDSYKNYPLAVVLLNGAMANSFYRSGDKTGATFQYYERVITVSNQELIPNVQLHIKQLYAYVVAESDIYRCITLLEESLKYANEDKHRVDIFEYYQCKGELSFAYWCAGKKEKAIETLSSCLEFVLPQAESGRRFAKTYLCLCNCLLNKYSWDLQGKAVPDDQASPHFGMFTENELNGLDDLYTEDRQYVSCYQMSDLCECLQMKELSYEWACMAVEACKKRREVQETHYMLFLLLPIFVDRNDFETIKYIMEHSIKARQLTYQKHPEINKGNADLEFVEFQIVPLLMSALVLEMRGEKTGMLIIRDVLDGYKASKDEEGMKLVKEALSREEYNRDYIAEINKLDVNERYSIYICAYLITAVHSDADYAFSLLICLLPNLEKQLVQVLGSRVIGIINHFVSSFWKTKIMLTPEEFANHEFLRTKGIKVIDEYEGKVNQANHTMLVVSNHLKKSFTLNNVQEDWLYA